jgi:hypothetical protein
VLLAVVADQGLADGLGRGMAARVVVAGQLVRVALAGDDGADDPHPGGAAHVRDHVVRLQVHLRQRLLQVLDVGGGMVEQPLAAGAGRRATSRPRPWAGSWRAAAHCRRQKA